METPPAFPEDPELHQLLRSQPYPCAPASLGEAVIARLERRQALTWWRRPIPEWPLAARTVAWCGLLLLAFAFAYGCGAVSPASVYGESLPEGSRLGSLALGLQTLSGLGSAARTCLTAVPLKVWWMVGGTLGVAYAACLALGSFIYRRMANLPA